MAATDNYQDFSSENKLQYITFLQHIKTEQYKSCKIIACTKCLELCKKLPNIILKLYTNQYRYFSMHKR